MIETQHDNFQMNMLSDSDILTLVNNGNIELFDVLTRRYKNRLMNYTYHFLHDYNISQDIVMESFLITLRKRRINNNGGNICIEIFSTVSKLMNDTLMQKKKQDSQSTFNNGESSRIEQVEIDQYFATEPIQMALDFLEAHNREALILRDIEGMCYSDISAITHETIREVKNRVHNARIKLINF